MEVSQVSRVNCIPHYPGLTAIQFDRGVLNEIRENGYLVEYLYMENCSLRYLPYYVFDFLPNLKWLDLRLVSKKYTMHNMTTL